MSGTSAPFRIRSTHRSAPSLCQTHSILLDLCASPNSKALQRLTKTNTARTTKHPPQPCRSTHIRKPENAAYTHLHLKKNCFSFALKMNIPSQMVVATQR